MKILIRKPWKIKKKIFPLLYGSDGWFFVENHNEKSPLIRWGSTSHPHKKKEYKKTNENQFSPYGETTKIKNGDEKKNFQKINWEGNIPTSFWESLTPQLMKIESVSKSDIPET